MNDLDIRKQAEKLVEKLHINDMEWKEILTAQYVEMLMARSGTKKEYLKPILIIVH